MSKPSRRRHEELEAENAWLKARLSHFRQYGIYAGVTKVCGELVRGMRVATPFLFVWLSVREISGKTTTADVDASLVIESQTISDALESILGSHSLVFFAVAIGIIGICYGRLQAKLRKDDVEHLHKFQLKYEQLKDAKRSSSRLTARGETRPEDE